MGEMTHGWYGAEKNFGASKKRGGERDAPGAGKRFQVSLECEMGCGGVGRCDAGLCGMPPLAALLRNSRR
jgi:hypothetical protein